MRKAQNLRVVEHAMRLAEQTYVATAGFPSGERFGLVSQMRRAVVSIGSNIAEGCGRSSAPQMLHFLQIASGSASELEYQARLAIRLHFGDAHALETLQRSIEYERRMLARLISKIRAARGEARSEA